MYFINKQPAFNPGRLYGKAYSVSATMKRGGYHVYYLKPFHWFARRGLKIKQWFAIHLSIYRRYILWQSKRKAEKKRGV